MSIFVGELVRTRQSILNVKIDGTWRTYDFIGLLNLVADLYGWFADPGEGATEEDAKSGIEGLLQQEVLGPDGDFTFTAMGAPRVASIEYASPGGINILGLGDCLKHVMEFIRYYLDRDLHREKLRLENAAAHLETMQHLQKMLKDAKAAKLLTDEEAHKLSYKLLMRELPHLRLVAKNVELNKITSMQIREVDPIE